MCVIAVAARGIGASFILAKFWSIAQVKFSNLAKAERNLALQGFEFYNPMYRRRTAKRGAIRERKLPLFPGYLFVCIIDQWHALFNTYGVSGLLLANGQPAKISTTYVDALRAREDGAGCVLLKNSKFEVGQTVQVKSGPFAFEFGLYEGQRDRDRVQVLLKLLGRACAVSVSEDNLVAA